jgi:ABC-type Fe3+/spermidine/putrescine transport system ATPase subunit
VSAPGQSLAPEARRVGMVFQDYALFPHLDVGQNVGFGIDDQPKAQRQARVGEVLALVGLSDVRRRYPHELSGGQQQRGRWPQSPSCCYWTSRFPTWMSICASAWRMRCAVF